jgi:ABC-2 type transport system ATP-binding protein
VNTPAIELESVGRVFDSRSRRPVVALENVSFTVEHGEVVGLLGSNGAGKTTIAKILATLLLPTSGLARIHGIDVTADPTAVRRLQSIVLGGDRGLYGRLSARENLRYFAMLDGLDRRALRTRVDAALDEVGLGAVAEVEAQKMSKGMRQRLHIAIGMISRPRVLLLDEPTVGLDPAEAQRLRQSIAELSSSGVSVLLTSHYLVDIERLADRVVMLEHGRVTHQLSVEQLAEAAGYVGSIVVRGHGTRPELSDTLTGVIDDTGEDQWAMRVSVRSWSTEVFVRLGEALTGRAVDGVEVQPVRLEDAFLSLQQDSR